MASGYLHNFEGNKAKFIKHVLLALPGLYSAHALGQVSDSVIVSAKSVGVSVETQASPGYDEAFMIDQSGLSESYVSGVTSFDALTSTATHNIGISGGEGDYTAWRTKPVEEFPALLTFEVGDEWEIDKLAIWSLGNGDELGSFKLYADSDSDFGNGTTADLGIFNHTEGKFANIYEFAATSASYFHIEAYSINGLRLRVGEVAFGTKATEVPGNNAPLATGSLGLLSVILGAGFLRRKL